MPNILTFDVEEWHRANYDGTGADVCRGRGGKLAAQVDALLQLCADSRATATFFVLGSVGEDYPGVVRTIAGAGHEIAAHGYSHELAYRQTFAEFKADVAKAVAILEGLTGRRVLGYRAPSWSIVAGNLHYLEALEELGLKYDASIFPVKTFLYGIADAPAAIHRPRVGGRELALWEVPMSVTRLFGRNFGYSGGFYFRLLPAFFVRRAIEAANRLGRPAILYLHPREIDPGEQRLALPPLENFIHYHNLAATKAKLADILRRFEFTSIAGYLAGKNNAF